LTSESCINVLPCSSVQDLRWHRERSLVVNNLHALSDCLHVGAASPCDSSGSGLFSIQKPGLAVAKPSLNDSSPSRTVEHDTRTGDRQQPSRARKTTMSQKRKSKSGLCEGTPLLYLVANKERRNQDAEMQAQSVYVRGDVLYPSMRGHRNAFDPYLRRRHIWNSQLCGK
jgi:hypothetical protein